MSKEKLKYYDETNPLSHFFECGMSPSEVKDGIIESFTPYFQNQENLEKHSINDVVNAWLGFVLIYRDDPDLLGSIDGILEIFNGAKQLDFPRTTSAYAQWLPEISQSISKFWSLNNSQLKHSELCFEDFAEYSLRIIGQSIEGLSKPMLMLLFHLNRIKRSKACSYQSVRSKDLGIIIDELITTSSLENFLTVDSIRLNQWRNIAYHHNYKFINGKLACWYNKSGEKVEFEISRNSLETATKRIARVFNILRIAETIFVFDNLSDIQDATIETESTSISIREEAKLIDIYSSIGTQGFKVLNLSQGNSDTACLVLQDMMQYSNSIERSAYSSQFLYSLWLYTGASRLTLIYHQSNGEKFATYSIDIDAITMQSVPTIGEFLEVLQLKRHIKDLQDIDPFAGLIIPKSLRESSFLSQRGEPISTKEFVKQFTLSTFCNYLVLVSEESTESIKTNIGSEGSICYGEGKKGNFIFHLPAHIESKKLQKLIIKMLERTILLYSDFRLKPEIVEAALNNNRYYQKKASIRQQMLVNESNK